MNLQQLIRRFRVLAKDTVVNPPLTADEDIKMWLNDGLREAAIRGRLIRDHMTEGVASFTYGAGTQVYTLHPSVVEIISVRRLPVSGGRPHAIYLHSPEWMDRNACHWRDDPIRYRYDNFAVQDDKTLQLVSEYQDGDTIALDCYRTPIDRLSNPNDEPEIHEMHHEYLVQWALHRAFSVPDADLYDPNRSKDAEREFTKYFGIRPDSDARRATRSDEVQHNYPML